MSAPHYPSRIRRAFRIPCGDDSIYRLLPYVVAEQAAAVDNPFVAAARTVVRTCAVAEAGRGIGRDAVVARSASWDLAGQPVRLEESARCHLRQLVHRTIMMGRWRPFWRCCVKVVNTKASCARDRSVEMITVSWRALLNPKAGATYLILSWRVLPIRRLRRPLLLWLPLRRWCSILTPLSWRGLVLVHLQRCRTAIQALAIRS